MKELKECVVVDAVRTPIGKSGRAQMKKLGGSFRECSAQDLLVTVLRSVVDRTEKKYPDFDPKEIEDLQVGCLSQLGEQGGNIARIAIMLAGLPDEIAGATVNRYCNAGLQAINTAANAIRVGDGDICLAAGVESMTHYAMGSDMFITSQIPNYPMIRSPRWANEPLRSIVGQGVSSEMINDRYSFTREDLDKFGVWSHQKATKAMRNEEEYFKRVVPVTYQKRYTDENMKPIKDESTGKQKVEDVTVTKDQTVRSVYLDDPEKGWEMISSLKPVFRPAEKGGKTTAGNSSQIVDGAAATLLMSREKADELGIKPMARILSTAVAGGEPIIMLLAPIPAMQKALDRADLTIDDMDVIEPNEAFASPCLAFSKDFGYEFDDPRVNPTGGAIAIGHPIGASGVIYFGEMIHYLKNNNKKYGVQLMCGGFGVGIATVVEAL
ncbi:MAG: thiolase family protein [Candidatus Lokiarchaeota archaeon]|nr:thiolase family protein [Candidatus Lokiarchaeota archaeon]